MGITIVPGSIDPESIADEGERLKDEARAQLLKDYPTAKFRDGEVEDPAAATAEPKGQQLAPRILNIGRPGAPNRLAGAEPTARPQDEGGFVEAVSTIPAALRAGGKELHKVWESMLMKDLEDQRDDGIKPREYDNGSFMSRFNAGQIPMEAQLKAAPSNVPKAEREKVIKKSLEAITAINAEIAGEAPKSKAFWTQATYNAAKSVAFMAPALVAGVAAKQPGALVAIGSSTFYQSYADNRAKGVDTDKAAKLAGVDGLIEAVTEAFPVHALFAGKTFLRKLVWELAADIPGEQVANYVQTATQNLGSLPANATKEQIMASLKGSVAEATSQIGAVTATTVLAGGAQAGAVRLVEKGLQAVGGKPTEEPAPPQNAPPPAPTVPQSQAASAPASSPPPVAPGPSNAPVPAATAESENAPAGPQVGQPALFQPNPNAPGAVVVIQKVTPGGIVVSRVDPETGDVVVDKDGNPATFVATPGDLKFVGGPKAAPATPAPVPTPAPAPAQAPPAATSAEPVVDLVAQVKDMYRAGTPRRGVYVSPATVTSMKQNGTYPELVKTGVVAENFDGQGGTLIVKSKKDMQEAVAARDSGIVDMQEIIGRLTGAGVSKPKAANAPVVQRRDETGGIVQQSAVLPEQVPAAVAAAKELPGTVEVTTPEAVIGERAQRVAEEKIPVVEAPQKPKPGDVFGAADFGVLFAIQQLNTPKEGNLTKTDVRASAQAVGAAAQMVRQAALEAQARGAPVELVAEAIKTAASMERIGDKPEKDFVKGRGVSEPKLRAKITELQAAMQALKPYRDQPRVAAVEAPVKHAKGEAAKKGKRAETKADKVAAEVLANPAVAAGVVEDQAKMREKVEAPAKAAEAEARAEMKPEVKAAVENAEKVFSKEQERRKVQGAPPEGVAERRKVVNETAKVDKPTPEVGPTGIAVAPPGERVVHRKKKYIPPKKTAEQVATQVAEDTAPGPVTTIDIVPAAVQDQGEFVTELLGATPKELQQEASMDRSGQMMKMLGELVGILQNRNSWTGWFASVTRGGVLTLPQRNQMLGLIRQYASAERSELPAVREQLLGHLTNLDGKTLPQEAIGAVFEAANVARAYTTMATNLRDSMESPDSDLGEIQAATSQVEFDKAQVNPLTGSLGVARENEIGGTARTKPIFNSLEDMFKDMLRIKRDFHPLRRTLRALWGEVQAHGYLDNLAIRSMKASANGSALPGAHEVLDQIIASGRALGTEHYGFMRLLTRLRATIPNVPIEFVPPGKPMLDEFGEPDKSGSRARYVSSGFIQLAVDLTSGGTPRLSAMDMQVMLHEMIHAATVYELVRGGDNKLSQEITTLRKEIIERAKDKLGGKLVDDMLEYFQTGRYGGAARPKNIDAMGEYLYGLTNNAEFLAEAVTQPGFQGFLHSLDQSPTKSWVRQMWNSVVRMYGKLLGVKNPAENRLLNDALVLAMRTMAAQRGRASRVVAARDQAVEELVSTLKIPRAKAEDMMARLYGGHGALKEDIATLNKLPDYPEARGSVRDDGSMVGWDQLAANVYGRNLESLSNQLSASRVAQSATFASLAPRLKNHEQIAGITSPRLANAAAGLRRLMTSKFVAAARDKGLGFLSTDFIVSRGARLFGATADAANPLVAWKRIRDTRRSYANQLLELAEKTVNSKWMKLSAARSEQLGTLLQQSTLWQIDPEQGASQTKLLGGLSQNRWTNKVNELNNAWAKLDAEQKDLYRSVQKYFQREYAQIRRAGIDLAIELYGGGISDVQRTMLYTVTKPEGIDQLVGHGQAIDLGEGNDKFKKVLRDLIRVSSIKGPYFPLMRKGNLVVEAGREGTLNGDNGQPRSFDTKAEAQVAANGIKNRAPKNKAKVVAAGNKFQVEYNVRHVSFHESQADAEDAIAQLRKQGFEVGVFTRKLESVESATLSEGLKELMSKAESITGATGPNASAEQQAIVQTLQSAFMQILAERAASASQQLKRQGVEGFKGKEAHEIFARRVKASSWHFANLKTAMAQSKALTRLRTFSRDIKQGARPSDLTPQGLALARGRTMMEITKRLRVEAEELGSLDRNNLDMVLSQLGFVNFLLTPSYTFVNAMQNFNVAMPYIFGKYGMKGAKGMVRAMKVISGPTFGNAMRGLFNKPGEVTVYDVYSAIATAVGEHPRFARFTESVNGKPSAMQELVDLGIINASFVQELSAVANNQSLLAARGMEYLRLFPQGAELWNRISTSLAVLEATNGNVEAAAEAVRMTHFDYNIENRPRYFRQIGSWRGIPQAITMFKMYGVGMYQLTGSLIADSITRRGQSKADRARAATALAGIIAAHTLSAGILGGIMLEPLRLLMQLWRALFGDDDEFGDLDTNVQKWATEVTGSEAGGRMLSRGVWTALGFDLSGRMGLDRVLMYDPPEGFTEDEGYKMIAGLLGPIPSTIVQKAARAYQLAAIEGRPYEAIIESIPVRLFQDARKGWQLINEGVESRSGETVIDADQFSWVDAMGRAAGFQTTAEGKVGDQASTAFSYRGWRSARVRELSTAFWQAHEQGDTAAEGAAVSAIERFNQKNPGAPITRASLLQSKQSAQRAVKDRTGQGRNEDLNRLLDY